MANSGEPWRFETVAGDRAVRGAVCHETKPCGGWAVRGLPRHEPNRGGSVRYVRTAAVCGSVVNTSHGPSLDDDKAPATGHRLLLQDKTPVTTPAATFISKLPMVAISKQDLSFELHGIQDLDALADVELLWDIRGEGADTRQRERG